MSYVLGIDLGTSSMKGVLINRDGNVITTVSHDYPIAQNKSGYSEQDPQKWCEACEVILDKLKQKKINFTSHLEGISFSGQMHSIVLLDSNKSVLRPSILWNDTRTTKECKEIMEDFGSEILEKTYNVALEGFTLPKILWIKKNEPEIWNKVRYIMLPKDYLNYYLTNEICTDYSDASGTLLFDIKSRQWSDSILNKFKIEKKYLPKVLESTDQVGILSNKIKNKYKFKNEVKVFTGAADNACGAIGSGVLSEDASMVSIGTSGVFLSYEKFANNNYQGKLHMFNHAKSDSFYSMGVTLSAGKSLSWFKDAFAPEMSFDDLLKKIDQVPIGSKGLIFTPYINGERTPYADSMIRGSFIGIDGQHTLNYFTRSVLEGITFSLKDSKCLMEKISGRKCLKIISVGGGAKNDIWIQMQADIFNVEIKTLVSEEGPGFGAAVIGAVGLKWFKNIQNCVQKFVKYKDTVYPIQKNVEKYNRAYEIYQQVYSSTREISYRLNNL